MKNILLITIIFCFKMLNGQDWHKVYHFDISSDFIKEYVDDFQFISSNVGYFSSSELTSGSSPGDAYLYMTKNSGINWDKIYTLNESTLGSSASLYFDFLNVQDFFIYESTNGGLCQGKAFRDSILIGTAFTPYPPPYINNINKDTIILSAFTDEQYIFMLLLNEDTLKKIPISDSYIYNYGFCDNCDFINSVCFLSGFGAAIGERNGLNFYFRTNNNIEDWVSDTLQIVGELKEIYFVNPNIGFIICDDSILYRTSNGGIDWEKNELPQQMFINDIRFDINKGYIIGKYGQMASSTDYGVHWVMEQINTQNSIEQLSVVNDIGFIMDSEGQIFTNNPNVLDVEMETIQPKQKIFPNPVNDRITLISDKTIESIELFNVYGQIVPIFSEIQDNTATLKLNFLSSGIYFIRVNYGNRSIIQKIIKN